MKSNPDVCECEFDPSFADEDGGESWHYKRSCTRCGMTWAALHCPHDGIQNPCPHCGVLPMTLQQVEMARHALGLDGRHLTPYRNRYVLGPETSDHAVWMAMVEAGLAQRRDGATMPYGGMDLFWLTRAGAEQVLRDRETLGTEYFPEESR